MKVYFSEKLLGKSSAPGATSEKVSRQVPYRSWRGPLKKQGSGFKKNPTAKKEAVGKSKHTMRKLVRR